MREWLLLSLQVAGCATLLTVGVGVSVALFFVRSRFPGRSLLEGLTLLPLVMPPTVLGYYLLVAFGADSVLGRWYHRLTGADLVFAFPGIVLAASLGALPLMLRQAQVAFAEIDSDFEDAARVFGANEGQVLRHVTFPLARRGLIAGTALAFARALGDFGATLMIGGNIPGRTRTLPLAVYDAWQSGDDATASGLALLLVSLAFLIAVVASRLSSER